jgi:protein-ribulosamine 3-kinase
MAFHTSHYLCCGFEHRAFDDMYYLIDKYAPFSNDEGPLRLSDSERVSLSVERDHTLA